MLTANSPIYEIALEAKDTSDDVRQVALATEASCKNIDHSVSSMPLGDVPKFVDDFPISGITITPDMIGYGVDTKDNEYDITNIFEKQVYDDPSGSKFQYVRNTTLNSSSNLYAYVFSNKNIATIANDSYVIIYDYFGKVVKSITSFPSGRNLSHTFYRGSSGEDVYIRSCVYDSQLVVEHYNQVGDLIHSVTFSSLNYFTYQHLTFDNNFYYCVSRRTSSGSWYLEKYDKTGNLLDQVIIASNQCLISTERYLLLLGSYANSNQTVYNKDLSKIDTFKIPGTTESSNKSNNCNLLGLDFVAVGYGNNVYLLDLKNLTGKLTSTYSFIPKIGQHGSCFISVSGTSSLMSKVDHYGNSVSYSINSDRNDNLVSNGEIAYSINGVNCYSYRDLAQKYKAAQAQKRG